MGRLLRGQRFVSAALGQPSHPLTYSYGRAVMSPHFCQSQRRRTTGSEREKKGRFMPLFGERLLWKLGIHSPCECTRKNAPSLTTCPLSHIIHKTPCFNCISLFCHNLPLLVVTLHHLLSRVCLRSCYVTV